MFSVMCRVHTATAAVMVMVVTMAVMTVMMAVMSMMAVMTGAVSKVFDVPHVEYLAD